MALSANDLKIIHLKKLATPGKKYYGDNEEIYLGNPNGSLRLLDKSELTTFGPTIEITSKNAQDAIEELANSIAEQAQDAVGSILTDSSNIEFTYDDTVPSITADLTDTTVTAGTYGDATHVTQVTYDAKGRAINAADVAITFPANITNLGIANKTATTLDITSSSGSSATVPEATITEAGLLNATDKVKLNNTSGTNSGNETASTIGVLINGSSAATPNDTDLVATADASVLKKITWTNVKAFLKTYYDTIYTTTSAVATQITTALSGYLTSATAASTYQPLDSDLTTIAGLTATTDNFIQSKSSAWASRTVAQVKTDLLVTTVTRINTDSSAVTGTTAETYLQGILVPQLTTNSVLDIRFRNTKTGTAGVGTPKLYYNTTNDMAGSPVLLATGVHAAASLYAYFERRIVYKNSLSLCTIFRTTVAAIDDRANNASALSTPNVDLSGKYLVISVTSGSAADSIVCADIQLTHYPS